MAESPVTVVSNERKTNTQTQEDSVLQRINAFAENAGFIKSRAISPGSLPMFQQHEAVTQELVVGLRNGEKRYVAKRTISLSLNIIL